MQDGVAWWQWWGSAMADWETGKREGGRWQMREGRDGEGRTEAVFREGMREGVKATCSPRDEEGGGEGGVSPPSGPFSLQFSEATNIFYLLALPHHCRHLACAL